MKPGYFTHDDRMYRWKIDDGIVWLEWCPIGLDEENEDNWHDNRSELLSFAAVSKSTEAFEELKATIETVEWVEVPVTDNDSSLFRISRDGDKLSRYYPQYGDWRGCCSAFFTAFYRAGLEVGRGER